MVAADEPSGHWPLEQHPLVGLYIYPPICIELGKLGQKGLACTTIFLHTNELCALINKLAWRSVAGKRTSPNEPPSHKTFHVARSEMLT
jgi:hypothetical protein